MAPEIQIGADVIEAAARALHAEYLKGPAYPVDFEEAREQWEAEAEVAIRAAFKELGMKVEKKTFRPEGRSDRHRCRLVSDWHPVEASTQQEEGE
jgi:hypothetical protein